MRILITLLFISLLFISCTDTEEEIIEAKKEEKDENLKNNFITECFTKQYMNYL